MSTTGILARSGRFGNRRLVTGLTAAALVVVGVTGCDPDAEDSEAGVKPASAVPVSSSAKPALRWGACPALPAGATRDPRLTCATVKVPLDYGKPNGPSIEVAISRLPTAVATKRKGVLVVNPGGPALPGLDVPGAMAKTLPKSVRESYDLIGFGQALISSVGVRTLGPSRLLPARLTAINGVSGSVPGS